MRSTNKFNIPLSIVIGLGLMLGCGGGDQQTEANKIVVDANKKLAEVRELLKKTESRNHLLFGANIKSAEELKSYKVKMAGEAKDIVESYEKVGELLKEIAGTFEGVSQMNVSENYKEYARVKAEEFTKRSEGVGIVKGNAQAFIDIADTESMTKQFDENNAKTIKLFADADELGKRATKMENENPTLFAVAK